MDLATIALAINLSSPKLLPSRVQVYSKTIAAQSAKLEIDPLIIIAIIKHESHWVQGLISRDGEDYGLMQVRSRYSTTPPERLLLGENNIIVGTYMIKSSQHFCEKRKGQKPSTQEWLACYQGSCTGPGHMCKPTRMTSVVEQYAQCLRDAINERMSNFDCDLIYKYELSHPRFNRTYTN